MKISLIVPVYNEEESIETFYRTVRDELALKEYIVEIVFINDGSQDKTAQIAASMASEDPLVILINFSRNFGKEAALFAGIEHATGEAIIPVDVDLQDPIEVIPKLIEKWKEGADVVLAKRTDRSHDGYLKRRSAELFYKIINQLSESKVEENVGDFRLLSRHVVEALKQLPERKLFMKGLFSWVGFDTKIVEYTRPQRSAGTTKFNGWKLWNLALEGITSFSTIPLRIWTYLGTSIAFLSLICSIWMIFNKLLWGNPVPGYPSLITAILFFGGVQLIGIGVLGEYIGRIYMETKQRPRYIIKNIVRRQETAKPFSSETH